MTNVPLVIPDHRALRKNVGTFRASFKRLSHNLFRMPKAVDRRGVNPVDAEAECVIDGCDRFAIVLSTPAELPAAAAYRPATKTQRRDE